MEQGKPFPAGIFALVCGGRDGAERRTYNSSPHLQSEDGWINPVDRASCIVGSQSRAASSSSSKEQSRFSRSAGFCVPHFGNFLANPTGKRSVKTGISVWPASSPQSRVKWGSLSLPSPLGKHRPPQKHRPYHQLISASIYTSRFQ